MTKYEYFSGGLLKSITDANLNTTSYTYDTRYRLESVASPTGTVVYTYEADDRDRIESVKDSADASKVWHYDYYPDGSLKTITAPEGAYTYTYNAVGQVANVAYPNGSSVAYAYDLQHRRKQIQNQATATSLISQYDYSYDGGTGPDALPMKGMISSVTEQFKHTDQNPYGPYTTSYGYDQLYQLTKTNYPNFDDSLNVPWDDQLHEGTYGPTGSRLTYKKTRTGTGNVLDLATYTYKLTTNNKVGPQLASIAHTNGEPKVSFGYDANGNQITQTVTGGAATNYTWDMDDKMVGLTTTDISQSASYTYSYTGDRLKRTLTAAPNPAATWTYLYNREDILKVDQGGTDPMYMTQGPGIDDVLAESTAAGTSYAYKNMLSSVLQLADASGAVGRNYNYSAWGESTNWPAPGTDNGPYGYTGREWEMAETYSVRRRFLQAATGRFFSLHGIKRLDEGYGYVYGNPITYYDPDGTSAISPVSWEDVLRGIGAVCSGLLGMGCSQAPSNGKGKAGPPSSGQLGQWQDGWDECDHCPPTDADKRRICCDLKYQIADAKCKARHLMDPYPRRACEELAIDLREKCLQGYPDSDLEDMAGETTESELWTRPKLSDFR